MAEACSPQQPVPPDRVEPGSEVGPDERQAQAPGRGFRLQDSGELDPGTSDLALIDSAPQSEALEVEPPLDSSVDLLDVAPGAEPWDSARFRPAAAVAEEAPRRPAGRSRAGEFYPGGEPAEAAGSSPPTPESASLAGYAVCPACEAKNAAEATTCGRCSEPIPPAIPDLRATGAALAPGVGVRVTPRGASPQANDDVLPEHARITIQARRDAQAVRREEGQLRWRAKRRALMLKVAVCFAVGGLLPGLIILSSGLWVLTLLADMAIGALAARYLLDHDANVVMGQVSFGLGGLLSTAIKCALGTLAFGAGLVVIFLAGVVTLFVAVIMGGLVGRALEVAALDEA